MRLEDDHLTYTRRWMAADAVAFVRLGTGERLRFVKTGSGPDLVLMHTVRTQLDLFQFVIPRLAKHFTVYAFDLPGWVKLGVVATGLYLFSIGAVLQAIDAVRRPRA